MSKPALVLLDVAVWLGVHVTIGLCAHRWPLQSLLREKWVTRIRAWEDDGRVWQRVARVRSWKRRLPEAGAAFAGGFDKSSIGGRSVQALERYAAETRRAELSHWVVMAAAPFFALWNPWYAAVAMLVYGVAVNVPCIISQRYNRARILRLLRRRAAASPPASPASPASE
ncbi:MAG TPA: hypothetical protein VNB24_02715 [Acidimicrobiales bacterium]|nr:hypothetical protein [Acidimicrobiales bacterium]